MFPVSPDLAFSLRQASSLSVYPDGTLLAVGLVDGTVMIFLGDLLKEKGTFSQKVVINGGNVLD